MLTVLQEGEYWKIGDVFLSARHLSKIFLYRPATNKIVWQKSFSSHQHDVDILDDHRIVIFDNNSIDIFGDDEIVDGNYQILIYDFRTDNVTKYLAESMEENDVRTVTEGLSEINSDGKLFIEEYNSGRILFFDQDGTLRWDFINRASNGLVYILNWSRLLSSDEDVALVEEVLANNYCE